MRVREKGMEEGEREGGRRGGREVKTAPKPMYNVEC